MNMQDKDYEDAVTVGQSVALAVAVKRFRDEYKWAVDDVQRVGMQLVKKIQERLERETDTIAGDLTRMEAMGRPVEHLRESIIAAFALIGAQVCESFEMARRAERN